MSNEFIKDDLRVFVVPVDVLELEELSIYEKMVYIVLRSFCNPHKPEAFPSYDTIAKMGSMSRRQAIYCVNSLMEKGLIKKERRYDVTKNRKIRHTSNLYTLQTPKKQRKSDCKEKRGDSQSPNLVHDMHHPSAQHAPGVVHDMHQGGAQHAPEHNQGNITNKNINGWMDGKASKNTNQEENKNPADEVSQPHTENFETDKLKREWEHFKAFCQDNGIDGSKTMDMYKVWRTHYNEAPLSIVIATLRELLHDKIKIDKNGWTEVEYRNMVGLFHHRMRVWREMAVAYEDIDRNGGWA